MPAVAANRGGVNMRILARVLVSMFVVALVLATNAGTNYAASVIKGPRLSQIALLSKFAHDNMPDEAIDLAKLDAAMPDFGLPGGSPAAAQINADVNRRPQNETSIAIKPGTSGETATWITGANDYGIGAPIGSGLYTRRRTTYLPPVPPPAYSGGPHDGRVYVTWTRFVFANGNFKEAPILLAWSDDDALTFSNGIVVSGASASLCPLPASTQNQCNFDQFSTPVVLPNGKVAISFINGNGPGFAQGFRDQYLVTVFDPGAGTLAGPFKVANVFDGVNDYPIQTTGGQGRATLCNSNFRFSSSSGLATDAAGTLYLTFSDDRKHAGEFPFPTVVASRANGYKCPQCKMTANDVFVWKSTT